MQYPLMKDKYSVKAYYGRTTYAFLDKCCFCGRPYDGSDDWQIVEGGTPETDTWLIACGECRVKPSKDSDGR